jgi:hypothetical protein
MRPEDDPLLWAGIAIVVGLNYLLFALPFALIARRAGYGPWLVGFIFLIGPSGFIPLWFLAFWKWPLERRARQAPP